VNRAENEETSCAFQSTALFVPAAKVFKLGAKFGEEMPDWFISLLD